MGVGRLHCSVNWAEKCASVRETFWTLSSHHPNGESFRQTHVLESVFLLPDILREFNGNLRGYSVGTGDASSTSAFLNQAVPGAKAEYDIWGSCGQSLRYPIETYEGTAPICSNGFKGTLSCLSTAKAIAWSLECSWTREGSCLYKCYPALWSGFHTLYHLRIELTEHIAKI